MPCRDSWEDDHPSPSLEALTKRLDKVSRLLCYLIGELREDGLWYRYENQKDLKDWLSKHHAADCERVKAAMKDELVSNPDLTAYELANRLINRASKVHPVSRWHKMWFVSLAEAACKIKDAALRKKKRRDFVARKALKKLSKEERKALGL